MDRVADIIAVTGSTGMVGSHLVAELLSRGYRRIILPVRDAGRLDKLRHTLTRELPGADITGLTPVEMPLTDSEGLSRALEGCSTLFNCAAAVSLGGMEEKTLVQGNAALTRSVVDACVASGTRRLVHVSSIASLGKPAFEGNPADETSEPSSIDELSGYGRGKYLSELEVERGRRTGLKTVIVNPSVIIGAGDWKSGSTAMIPLLASGLPFYTGGISAFVDVRDVARAMVTLCETPQAEGERFVLSAGNVSYKHLLELAAAASGRKPPRWRLGRTGIRLASEAEKIIRYFTGGTAGLTPELTAILLKKSLYSGEKIKKTCNFGYTPLEDTVQRVVRQYISETRR